VEELNLINDLKYRPLSLKERGLEGEAKPATINIFSLFTQRSLSLLNARQEPLPGTGLISSFLPTLPAQRSVVPVFVSAVAVPAGL